MYSRNTFVMSFQYTNMVGLMDQCSPDRNHYALDRLLEPRSDFLDSYVTWVPPDYQHVHNYNFTSEYAPSPATAFLGYNFDTGADKIHPAVSDGDVWVSSELCSMSFSDLAGAKIAVEATNYLQHMIDEAPAHEPLLAALGGYPIGLKQHIKKELDNWKANDITPVFVFDGQSMVGKEQTTLHFAKAALAKTQKAWELYVDNDPEGAVKNFGSSGAVRVTDLYPVLREILSERGLDFITAPFSACAQLAYLDRLDTQYIDGIMGSQELLLYDIHDAIIIPPSQTEWEKKSFSGIIKSDLIRKQNVTPDMFADALLMVGTSFLPPFPPLLDPNITLRQPHTIGDAINMLRTSEKSVTSVCTGFSDILEMRDPEWLDKFRKAKMAVKHCVTVHEDGSVHVRDYDSLTHDNSAYLGLQLPPELYHYLAKVVISPRTLNSFSSLETFVFPTLDGVASDEYRKLVTKSLFPLKETTASLISSRINRYFQKNVLKVRFWFDNDLVLKIDLSGSPNTQADTWQVKEATFKAQESPTLSTAGKLSFAVLALQDEEFIAKTHLEKKPKPEAKPLQEYDVPAALNSVPEILSNALWRLLHLRGYVNNKHELTSWGKALAVTLKALGPSIKTYNDVNHMEEAAFLAYELIRFDNLNSRNRHTELIGGPLRGTDEDKSNCLLIGRTACLLKLRHQNIGYTGPLSKNFLSFYSIVKAVKETDRDLLQAIVTSMFLNNQADRHGNAFEEISQSLPLGSDINIALGIAVKTYLDDFCKLDSTPAAREIEKQQYAEKLLPHSVNFAQDLDQSFKFFDALWEGIKTLGENEMSNADKKNWESAKAFLDRRR
ncbi:hypothetical protein B7494_g6798 [Chlorociboria aeruginascens]|nr:hypothetical protein B7494_g6798 [Chlorociboria aeruginascens]